MTIDTGIDAYPDQATGQEFSSDPTPEQRRTMALFFISNLANRYPVRSDYGQDGPTTHYWLELCKDGIANQVHERTAGNEYSDLSPEDVRLSFDQILERAIRVNLASYQVEQRSLAPSLEHSLPDRINLAHARHDLYTQLLMARRVIKPYQQRGDEPDHDAMSTDYLAGFADSVGIDYSLLDLTPRYDAVIYDAFSADIRARRSPSEANTTQANENITKACESLGIPTISHISDEGLQDLRAKSAQQLRQILIEHSLWDPQTAAAIVEVDTDIKKELEVVALLTCNQRPREQIIDTFVDKIKAIGEVIVADLIIQIQGMASDDPRIHEVERMLDEYTTRAALCEEIIKASVVNIDQTPTQALENAEYYRAALTMLHIGRPLGKSATDDALHALIEELSVAA